MVLVGLGRVSARTDHHLVSPLPEGTWSGLGPHPHHPCPHPYSFFFFRAIHKTYAGSQARGRIGAMSATSTTARGNVRSLNYRVRPAIELATSWFLVGIVSAAP